MTTTITPDTALARVARIVAAYTAADAALVELSDAIHDAVRVPEHDDAIAAGYALAYSGSVDDEGIPTGLLVHEHGDRLLLRAADIRQQLVELIETCYEVPSDFVPDPDAVRRIDALRRPPAPPLDGPDAA